MSPNYTWEGDSDAWLVTEVLQYLDIHLPSGYYAVAQPYVVIDAEDGSYRVYRHVRSTDLEFITAGMKPLVAHPDLAVLQSTLHQGKPGPDRIVCVVELDGSIHDTRQGRKQTIKRNAKYEAGKIPYVAINQADYRMTGESIHEGAWKGVKKHVYRAAATVPKPYPPAEATLGSAGKQKRGGRPR